MPRVLIFIVLWPNPIPLSTAVAQGICRLLSLSQRQMQVGQRNNENIEHSNKEAGEKKPCAFGFSAHWRFSSGRKVQAVQNKHEVCPSAALSTDRLIIH